MLSTGFLPTNMMVAFKKRFMEGEIVLIGHKFQNAIKGSAGPSMSGFESYIKNSNCNKYPRSFT